MALVGFTPHFCKPQDVGIAAFILSQVFVVSKWGRGLFVSHGRKLPMPHAVIEYLAEHPDVACLLLVHPDMQVIHRNANDLAAAIGVQPVSVGKELSAALLDEPLPARPRTARTWLSNAVMRLAPGPVLLTDIDLLFEPAWALDPLALFRSASRSARLIVTWPGTYAQETLAYAVPEHSAYRTWRRPGVHIVCPT